MMNLKERRMIELGTINYDPTGLKISSTSRGKSGLLFDSKGKIDLNSPATRELDAGCPRLDTSPDSKLNFSLVCIEDVKDYQMTALIGSPEAFDEFGKIAEGSHERVRVLVSKFAKSLESKVSRRE